MAVENMDAVKAVETKAAAPKAEPAKVAAPKAEAPKTEAKAPAKETVKKAAPKAAAKTTEKKPAVKKEAAPKKETVKKAPAAKKAPVKKAEPAAAVVIEYAGKQIAAREVLAAATKAFQAANKGVEIKTIEIYVKPEENVAYYVVNGEGSDDYKIVL